MPEFALELWVSRADRGEVAAGAERARRAAEELTGQGTPVRYLRSLYLPDEETCFYLYEAGTADDVREAARRAGLPAGSVAESIEEGPLTRSNADKGGST